MAQKKQAYITEFSARIIRDVRSGHASSRLELARRHKLAPSTMGIHVDRLIASGHLSQTASSLHRGRPIQRLSLRGNVGIFIGAEFEARTLHAVCVDFAGTVLDRRSAIILPGSDAASVLSVLDETITSLRVQRPEKLLGIGIGSPGIIDPVQGIARHYRFIEGWTDVPVVAHLREKFSVPVTMETNVRSTALGIQLYEKSFPVDDFVCVMVRSGVGAGIVRDGIPHQGDSYTSGEVGRITIPGSSPTTMVEDLCSIPAILRHVRENLPRHPSSPLHDPELSSALLITAARDGDPLARSSVLHAVDYLGWACHVLALVENPRAIVLVGPLSELGDWIQTGLQAALERHAAHSRITLPHVAVTSLGGTVGALGAASLAIEAWTP